MGREGGMGKGGTQGREGPRTCGRRVKVFPWFYVKPKSNVTTIGQSPSQSDRMDRKLEGSD